VLDSEVSTTLSPNAGTQRFTRAITRDLVSILDVGQLLGSSDVVVDHVGPIAPVPVGPSGQVPSRP